MDRHELLSLVRFTFLLLCVLLTFSCRNTADDRRMAQIIHEADSLNRNDIAMTNDSLLLMACRYYDRHGTPNEQMRAHYLLGCVYRDRGEAPRAIDSYKDAIAKADTTASDCDYHVLGCVYSQMGDTYHKQLLFSYEIEARRQAQYYALLAGDTVYAIWGDVLLAGSYIQQGMTDSAEYLLQESIRRFHLHHNIQDAVQASEVLMYIYAEQPEQSHNLKRLIDEHAAYSQYYDKQHELLTEKRQLYYYKGKYYEYTGLLDSAEYCYRKIQHPRMSFSEKVAQNKGLLSIYKKRHQADSIAKYAELYCNANDSSITVVDRELTARMAATYQYNSFRQIAFQKEKDAERARLLFAVAFITLIAICIISIMMWHRYKEQHRQKTEKLKAEYAYAIESYNNNLHTLRMLDETHKSIIAEIQEELLNAQHESVENRKNVSKLRLAYEDLSEKYKMERAELIDENEHLKQRINEMQQKKEIIDNLRNAKQFAEEPIIRRIFALREMPQIAISSKEKELLFITTGKYFPELLYDLKQTDNIQQLGIYVCILTALNLRSSDIANMLNISFQQVANLKLQTNLALFNDSSARTLYKNLIRKYNISIS